jgi:hypothetical protein
LPEFLPAGEVLLWQGTPNWRAFARRALHARGIAVYFALMLGWRIASDWTDGAALADIVLSAARFLAFAAIAMGVVYLIAWLTERTTVYSLTNRRIVMRIGIALPVTFNIPFSAIEAVRISAGKDGCGDLPMALSGGQRIAYLHLVPHARPWRFSRPEPMLRAVPDVERVGAMIAQAMTCASLAKNADHPPAPSGRQVGKAMRPAPLGVRTEEIPA